MITAAPAIFMAAMSCAGIPSRPAAENAVLPASGGITEAPGVSISPAAPLPVENRLASPAFKTIPAEARDYLERLSRAFASGDEAFLLAQGEPQFEADVRPRHDTETYLALLYRIETYAVDSPRQSVRLPRLVPAAVNHIQYLSWEENGPLLEIKAQLIGKDGKTTPCLIMLAWRLREPKIEGLFL